MRPTSNQFAEVAERIGFQLCRDAVWHEKSCTWLGWSKEFVRDKSHSTYEAMSASVYSGTAGIALFLAELFRFSPDPQIARVISGALNQIQLVLDDPTDALQHHNRLGVYTGQLGIANALIHIGARLDLEQWTERGLALVLRLAKLEGSPKEIDVLSGSAGAIPLFLKLHRQYGYEEFANAALMHGERLLRCAVQEEEGCSWATVDMSVRKNLAGYSHGAAGIVTACWELYRRFGDVRFLQMGEAGLRYERSLFDSAHKNWLDMRVMPGQTAEQAASCFFAWCHGAPGIGLARLRCAELVPDNEMVKNDLAAAIETCSARMSPPWKPGNGNYSLCHGAAGNAELLLMAGQQLGRADLTALAEKVGEEGIEFYVKQGLSWPCGNGGAGETPNLMLGTAGIGYFYLRLYDPVAVPSVLLISPE